MGCPPPARRARSLRWRACDDAQPPPALLTATRELFFYLLKTTGTGRLAHGCVVCVCTPIPSPPTATSRRAAERLAAARAAELVAALRALRDGEGVRTVDDLIARIDTTGGGGVAPPLPAAAAEAPPAYVYDAGGGGGGSDGGGPGGPGGGRRRPRPPLAIEFGAADRNYALARFRGVPQNPTFDVAALEALVAGFATRPGDVFVCTYPKVGR